MKQLKIFFLIAICSMISIAIKAQEFEFKINSPTAVSGSYYLYKSLFGPQDTLGINNKEIILSTPLNPCGGITNDISNKIVFLDRGPCTAPYELDGSFISKVRYAQNANAAAVIICNNDNPPTRPGIPAGEIDDITIKSFLMEKPDCDKIKLALLNEPIYANINQKLCVLPDTSSNIVWGNKQGEGDFAYGLNGWTYSSEENDNVKWIPNGIIKDEISLNSRSECNGIALIYNDHPCPKLSCKSSLISPVINIKEYSYLGLYLEFKQACSRRSYAGHEKDAIFYMFISKDNGVTWKDSFELSNYPYQSFQLRGFLDAETIKIKFEITGTDKLFWFWAIDDFTIKHYIEKDCGGLFLSSQSDINDYKDNNPGCTFTQIHMNAFRYEENPEVDLSPLSELKNIKEVYFTWNENVTFKNGFLNQLNTNVDTILIANNNNIIIEDGFLNGIKNIKKGVRFKSNTNVSFRKGILNNLDSINGGIYFYSNDGIIFPDGFCSILQKITGNISYYYNSNFNLNNEVFNNLASTNNITFYDNKNFFDYKGLNKLKKINGDFIFKENKDFNFFSFDSLERVSGEFNYDSNQNIIVSNTDTLVFFKFNININKDFSFSNNNFSKPVIINLSTLHNVNQISFADNPNLREIIGSNKITKLKWLSINRNKSLKNITGFYALKEGSLGITENDSIIKIDNFYSLETSTYLAIGRNNNLEFVFPFQNLVNIGELSIVENNKLESVNGFNALTNNIYTPYFSHYQISIENNKNLLNIKGFNTLRNLIRGINIAGNVLLDSIKAFKELKFIGNKLQIADNTHLRKIEGFESVDTIYSDLIINNNGIKELPNFINLYLVLGSINIERNSFLEKLESLRNLKKISGNINILENENLYSLSGLDNIITSTIGKIIIVNNYLLNYCHIKSICLFLDDHSIDAKIEGNDLNCGSIVRVKDACSKITSIDDDTVRDVLIYPNPASTELNIILNESTEISIRDLFGKTHIKQVVNFKNNIIDLSLLPKGVYHIYIKNKVHRIVKI